MTGSSWQFRTTRGVVTIEDDAIVRKSTPSLFLAGQRQRWRNGDLRERAKVAFRVVAFVFSAVAFAYHVALLADVEPGLSAALYAGTAGFLALSFWNQHLRATAIERSAIERVTVDDDERELTITHETDDGLLSLFGDDRKETTLRLGTADDLRNAREICRLRGIELEPAPSGDETETTYRVFTRDGVCFCERCRSQVSPSDAACPACDYSLRVEATETA